MSKTLRFFFLWTLTLNLAFGQCPPSNSTTTISGQYTADINPPNGSIVYVAPSATVTGNITLINASLHNCGTILSKRIYMKQSISDDQYILENNNVISSDSIIMDTLGHFHNNDSMICSFLKLRAKCKVDNNALLNVSHFKMEKQGVIYSPGTVNANYFDLTDYLTIFYNYYGSLSVKKHLNIASGAYVFNFNFICVDSCLTNNGVLTANASPTWTSTIKVNGLSQNTGTISLNDFCDYSSSIGGGPDINTGTLDNVTICTSTFNFCSFTIQSIRETPKEMSRIFLFPNPGTDVINLRLADQELEYTNIVILNPIGEVVFTGPFSNTINISELRAGVYFLRVTSSTINYTTKFLKG